MKVLLIRWLDHQSLAGWIEPNDVVNFCASGAIEAVSVGLEVYQDDDCVVISQTYTQANNMQGDMLKVMKNCIKQIKTVYTEK